MNAVSKVDEDKSSRLEMDAPTKPEVAVAPADPVREPERLPKGRKRRTGRFALMLALPLLLAVGGGYFWVTGGRYEETDNANLLQAKVSIAADTTGRIVKVDISENQAVKKGDELFVIDPEPYRIALAQSQAALATARLNVEQLRAAYSQAVAQQRSAAAQVDYAQAQFDRATDLTDKGINTRSTLDQARMDLDKARQQQAVAEQGVVSAKAALDGNPDIPTDVHPTVLAALAARDKAAYDLAQTTVRAPGDGIIAQASSFKVGQYVTSGTPLFALVETGDTWINANFKETQLTHMRPGQKADVELDTYPGRVFKATVEAVGAGTGAEFSLLPAQNATGNWVKVTQRIPVRLKLDEPETGMALRTGMSADVTVDTGVSRGFGALFGHAFAGEADYEATTGGSE